MGGSLDGDEGTAVRGVAGLEDAGAEQLSFCALPRYRHQVAATKAAAVIVADSFALPPGSRPDLALIRVDNPYLAVAAVVRHFFPEPEADESIHPTAIIGVGAELGQRVSVGACAVIGPECRVGSDTQIGAGCVLGEGTVVGADCRLYPNVTVYPSVTLGDRVILHAGVVLGADGFGYAVDGGRQLKIPQVGGVVIEDDVEIGANACIDRGALGDTRVACGTKIDNLVQIGHNCEIGEDSVLCGQAGLSGSTIIGRGVMIGGQAGLSGHLEVGDGAMIAADAGVISSIPAATSVAGYPQMEVSRWRRAMVAVRTLPDLVRRVRRLEAVLKDSKKADQ